MPLKNPARFELRRLVDIALDVLGGEMLPTAVHWLALLREEGAKLQGAGLSTNISARTVAITAAHALAHAARLPLFGSVEVLAPGAAPDAGGLRDEATQGAATASFSVPVIDASSEKDWRLLLRSGGRVASWIRRHRGYSPDRPAHRRAFFAFVSEELEALSAATSFRGKSTYHILRACHDAGIPVCHVAGSVFQLGWGARGRRIDRSICDGDQFIAARLTHNKTMTAQLLRRVGLPAAEHIAISDPASARKAAEVLGWPVVVKPADGERGEGVSVDVSPAGLTAAYDNALKSSPGRRVLVERQVQGVCHRLFIVEGKLLYAVRRLPLGLYGDGIQTITDLATKAADDAALRPPWTREPTPELDSLAMAELARQGLAGSDVPAAGAFVSLRRIETTAWGGVDEDVTAVVHPENIRIAEAAARVNGLAVAGIDIISPDIAEPWHANGAIINEVNFAPLLGEGPISRTHVAVYVERLMGGGDGRIPVEVFVGANGARETATVRAAELRAAGLRTAVTSHDWTEVEPGYALPMTSHLLADRVTALVLSPDTEAILIIVQNDGLLNTGIPLANADIITFCDDFAEIQCINDDRRRQLMMILRDWSRS